MEEVRSKPTLQNIGRFAYIEPNNPYLTLPDNAILHSYENYCMAVDLTVTIPDRYSCADKTGHVLTYSSSNGTINFFGGSGGETDKNGYLTTSFTDISSTNVGRGNKECLGIESINVSYQQWFYPIVNIKFVDVRGASLFMPQEKGLQQTLEREKMEREQGAVNNSKITQIDSGSFFKAVFSCPCPVFKLTVKGFYGKPITYNLKMSKFNSNFDATTGNSVVDMEFIGNMYGIYTEIPFIYTAVAPYIDDMAYWNSRVASGDFVFDNGAEMITLSEFTKRIKTSITNFEQYKLDIAKKNNYIYIEKCKGELQELKNTFPRSLDINNSIVLDEDRFNKEIAFISYSDSLTTDDVKTLYKYYHSLEAFSERYSQYETLIDMISDIKINENELNSNSTKHMLCKYVVRNGVAYKYTNNNINFNNINIAESFTKYQSEKNYVLADNSESITLSPRFKDAIDKISDKTKPIYIHVLNTEILYSIDEILNSLEKNKDEQESLINEVMVETIEANLGFKISIYNVFKMIFAHLECFIHHYYTALNQIKKQLDGNKNIRSISNFGGYDLTDIPKSYQYVPPYPLCISSIQEGDSTRQVAVWPEDVTGIQIEETKFTKALIKGAHCYVENAQKVLEEIKELEGNTKNRNEEEPIEKFIPATLYDIIFKQKNPYEIIANRSSYSDIDKANLIMATFMLRCYYTIYSFRNNSRGEINDIKKYVAWAEALNVRKAFGEKLARDTKNELSINTKSNQSINNGVEKAKSKTKSTKQSQWTIIDGVPMFSDTENWLYSLIKDGKNTYLPMNVEFRSNRNDVSMGKHIDSSKYICINDSQLNKDTFVSINNTDFLEKYRTEIGAAETYGLKEGKFDVYTKVFEKKYKHEDTISGVFGDNLSVKIIDANEKKNKPKISTAKNFLELHNTNAYLYTSNNANNGNFYFGIVNGEYERFGVFKGNDVYNANKQKPLAKAYLFLFSLPINSSYAKACIETNYGNANKWLLLREGAHYWREDESGEPINLGEYGKGFNGEKSLVPILRRVGLFGKLNNTLYLDKVNHTKNDYITFNELNGLDKDFQVSEARRNYLKKLFVNFATISNIFKDFYLLESTQEDSDDYNKLQRNLVNLLSSEEIFIDYAQPIENGKDKKIKDNDVFDCYSSFLKNLATIYEEKNIEVTNDIDSEDIIVSTGLVNDKDIKLSTYLTLKDLYDKFFCNINSDIFVIGSENSEFKKFRFIDSFYNDISKKLIVNGNYLLDIFRDTVYQSEGAMNTPVKLNMKKSVYEVMADICEHNGLTFLALPQEFGLSGVDNIEKMFSPQSLQDVYTNRHANDGCYIGLYSYKPSERLDIQETEYGYKNDSFDITDGALPSALQTINGDDLIPAFAVTYAKQNQSFFSNISLSTASQQTTEHSITATMDIAGRGQTDGPRESTLYGQDLYRVYAGYSYQCSVEMLGNMQVMPLMYFQLNNIPMWHGAYMIISVEHNIVANNITTKFTGVRVNRNAMPFVNSDYIFANENGEMNYVNITTSDPRAKLDELISQGFSQEQAIEIVNNNGVYGLGNIKAKPKMSPENLLTAKGRVTEAVKKVFSCGHAITSSGSYVHHCARWTFRLAQCFVQPDFDPTCEVSAGGNPNQIGLWNHLTKIGYKEETNVVLNKDEIKKYLANSNNFNYGDVVLYYNSTQAYGTAGAKMHAQFYTGDAYLSSVPGYSSNINVVNEKPEMEKQCKSGWSCDRLNNYGSTFVYGNDNKYPPTDPKYNSWVLKVFRAPELEA